MDSTGIVAIARILTVKSAALSLDVSWDSSPTSYFSVIEVNVGIVCACMITLRPLFAHMFPSWVKPSYAYTGYYQDAPARPGTKKSHRDTMTHAAHGIYGLADLEVNQVLNGSQELLTTPNFFEPAHFHDHHAMPRMSTSITSGGRAQSKVPGDTAPITRVQTRPGDIMVTRETTIMEEKRTVSPVSPRHEKDDRSWPASSPKELSESSSGY